MGIRSSSAEPAIFPSAQMVQAELEELLAVLGATKEDLDAGEVRARSHWATSQGQAELRRVIIAFENETDAKQEEPGKGKKKEENKGEEEEEAGDPQWPKTLAAAVSSGTPCRILTR